MFQIGDVLEHTSVTRNGKPLLAVIEKKVDDDFLLRIQESIGDAHHTRLFYREGQIRSDWRYAYVR